MYSQSFSPYNLYACASQSERRNSGLSKDDFVQEVETYVGNSIDEGTYEFKIKILYDLYLNNHPKGSMESICQDLVLRKLYNNIKRIYSVKQSNRNQIVKQMISLLKEESPKWVIRLDIKHFYESINRLRLIERLMEDGRLNFQSVCLIKILFAHPIIAEGDGLPRGLSISSAMSELYMKYFDIGVRRLKGVFYYARFVDDIIVFCSSQKAQEDVWEHIPKMLGDMGLQLNESKSYKWSDNQNTIKLVYLGYAFIPKGKRDLDVVIADKKVNMIKTRITKSFVRFAKDGDFDMLKNRIKFLTGNFTLSAPSTLLPTKVGIYFNYRFVTDRTALYELDKYFQKILHCKMGKLGSKLSLRMTNAQRVELTKYSFVFGFENHVNHFFTSAILMNVINCWK